MKERNPYKALLRAFSLFWILFFTACATMPEEMPVPEIRGRAEGRLFEPVEVLAGTSETAPYLPGKIRFEVMKRLEAGGLLCGARQQGQGLMVRIEVRADYPAFAKGEHYSSLESRVQVKAPGEEKILAQTVIRGYNSSNSIRLSDFTEITNAQEIVEFLEGIVR